MDFRRFIYKLQITDLCAKADFLPTNTCSNSRNDQCHAYNKHTAENKPSPIVLLVG